jgi:hypothetical protein
VQVEVDAVSTKPRITRRRRAGPRHAVLTIVGRAERGRGYRVEPCAQCAWRIDQIGAFPAEAFRLSAATAYDAATRTFGCHMSPAHAPLICAGFLLSPGALHNLLVRIAQAKGRLDLGRIKSTVPLYRTYRAMAIANGVSSDDPVLAHCRDAVGRAIDDDVELFDRTQAGAREMRAMRHGALPRRGRELARLLTEATRHSRLLSSGRCCADRRARTIPPSRSRCG